MTEYEELRDMKIHNSITIKNDSNTTVLRVIGGWIYTTQSHKGTGAKIGVTSCFVPYLAAR